MGILTLHKLLIFRTSRVAFLASKWKMQFVNFEFLHYIFNSRMRHLFIYIPVWKSQFHPSLPHHNYSLVFKTKGKLCRFFFSTKNSIIQILSTCEKLQMNLLKSDFLCRFDIYLLSTSHQDMPLNWWRCSCRRNFSQLMHPQWLVDGIMTTPENKRGDSSNKIFFRETLFLLGCE